jgi:hypothetical protein
MIGIAAGLPLGLLTARFKLCEDTLGALALGLQTLPSVCWVPLAILGRATWNCSNPLRTQRLNSIPTEPALRRIRSSEVFRKILDRFCWIHPASYSVYLSEEYQ